MPLTSRQAFKLAFLWNCAEAGLGPEEAHVLVKEALAKVGQLGVPVVDPAINATGRIIGGIAPPLIGLAALAGIGLPIAAGAFGGATLARSTEDETNVEEAKANEVLAEYERLTQQAKSRSGLHRGMPLIPKIRP